jgi:hypothetical protein
MVLSFGGLPYSASIRASTLSSTRRSWFSSHRYCGVNWIFKQSANALAISDGWNLRPEASWIPVDALGPSLLRRDYAMGHIAWDVTSVVLFLISHRSSAFLRVIRLIYLVTRLTAALHAGSLVSCHNFLSLCFCFSKWSNPCRSLFMCESVTLLVDSLYAEAIEAVKSRATLSDSTPC